MAIFGDSIANGLGSRGNSYGRQAALALGWDFHDLSGSAQTIDESLRVYETLGETFDVVLVAHGITEAIRRPTERALRFAPVRWRPLGWMDPRPYFSTSRSRRALERIESSTRWRVKNILMRLGGSRQLISLPDYARALETFISRLEMDGSRVIVLGPPDIDGRYFPGSGAQLRAYADSSKRFAVEYIEVGCVLNQWDDYLADHFHPNVEGHSKIAAALARHLDSTTEEHHAPQ